MLFTDSQSKAQAQIDKLKKTHAAALAETQRLEAAERDLGTEGLELAPDDEKGLERLLERRTQLRDKVRFHHERAESALAAIDALRPQANAARIAELEKKAEQLREKQLHAERGAAAAAVAAQEALSVHVKAVGALWNDERRTLRDLAAAKGSNEIPSPFAPPTSFASVSPSDSLRGAAGVLDAQKHQAAALACLPNKKVA